MHWCYVVLQLLTDDFRPDFWSPCVLKEWSVILAETWYYTWLSLDNKISWFSIFNCLLFYQVTGLIIRSILVTTLYCMLHWYSLWGYNMINLEWITNKNRSMTMLCSCGRQFWNGCQFSDELFSFRPFFYQRMMIFNRFNALASVLTFI